MAYKLLTQNDEDLEGYLTRVWLLALPQSYDLQFDKSDFLELLTGVHMYDEDCKKIGRTLLTNEELIG